MSLSFIMNNNKFIYLKVKIKSFCFEFELKLHLTKDTSPSIQLIITKYNKICLCSIKLMVKLPSRGDFKEKILSSHTHIHTHTHTHTT